MLKFTKDQSNDPSIEIAYYDSSNIKKSYFNSSMNTLTIVFNSGKSYLYHGVTEHEYYMFKMHESQGKYFNSTIKSKITEALDLVESMDVINEEIQSYNDTYADSLHELVKMKMGEYNSYNKFNLTMANDIIQTLQKIVDLKSSEKLG